MNTSHCNAEPSGDRAPATAHASFGHAGGIKAISLRLSAATPQEPHANQNASQRDASIHKERFRALGALAGIPSGCAFVGRIPVVSLRSTTGLIAAMPPASDPSLSISWDVRGFHNARHSEAVFIRVSSQPKDTMFSYPPKTAKNLKFSAEQDKILPEARPSFGSRYIAPVTKLRRYTI